MARLGNVGDDTTRGGASWTGVRTGGIRDMDSEVLSKTTSGIGEGFEVELRCSERRAGAEHVVDKGLGGIGVDGERWDVGMVASDLEDSGGYTERTPRSQNSARGTGQLIGRAGPQEADRQDSGRPSVGKAG